MQSHRNYSSLLFTLCNIWYLIALGDVFQVQLFIRFLLEVLVTVVFSRMARKLEVKLEEEELRGRSRVVRSVLLADDSESFHQSNSRRGEREIMTLN